MLLKQSAGILRGLVFRGEYPEFPAVLFRKCHGDLLKEVRFPVVGNTRHDMEGARHDLVEVVQPVYADPDRLRPATVIHVENRASEILEPVNPVNRPWLRILNAGLESFLPPRLKYRVGVFRGFIPHSPPATVFPEPVRKLCR